MEAVFYRLHERSINAVTRLLPRRARRLMEYCTLALAFCLLAALIYLHKQFVNSEGGTVCNFSGEPTVKLACTTCTPINAPLFSLSISASVAVFWCSLSVCPSLWSGRELTQAKSMCCRYIWSIDSSSSSSVGLNLQIRN